jgi:hypothetical protein
MKTRCADCSFKFEAASGRNKVCPSCKEGRKDKWRKDNSKSLKFIPPVAAPAAPRLGDERADLKRAAVIKKTGTQKSGTKDTE